MNSYATIVIVAIIAVGGGALVALAWWKVAARGAPYQDELVKPVKETQDSAVRIVVRTR